MADISFSSLVPAQTKIVPVVFITNQTLENIDTTATKLLAFKISKRIQGIITTNQLPTPEEIQIDCDWTGGTREKYFLLLTELQKFPLFQNTIWSATIRLHQVKFMENTGIPPVDRGMLMFYNMGNIEDINTPDSIYDKKHGSTIHWKKESKNIRCHWMPQLHAIVGVYCLMAMN